MKIGLTSAKLDQMKLSELVRWTIRPRLMAVPGVANVAVWGQRDRQLQVLVDPDRLRAAGVTLAEVRAAAGDTVQDAAGLGQAIVRQSGSAPIRLSDVARVIDGHAAPIDNLTRALLIGCALVAAELFLFTRDWRQAIISLTAIPLSLLGAGLVLLWSGATINVMVIAGLVIALGEVVDDAIIDVENIARRLRLEREAESPRSAFSVVLGASLEVRSAVVFASLIVMLVFLPIFFLGGVAGTFFQPLAIAYLLAIATSLLVALTVTPALCLLLLPGAPLTEERDTRLVRWLKRH
jgi:Cu/Ag efflux pump CusA